jgi:hypothetical protein
LHLESLEDRTVLSGVTAANAHLAQAYGQLPLTFEVNQGQADPQVNFLSHGSGYTLFLTPTEAVLGLQSSTSAGQAPTPATVLRMQLIGANGASLGTGLDQQVTRSNYLIGNDPSQWRTNIANYGRVEYRNVYPGVDIVYYGNQRRLEYDFLLAPGADPGLIALDFQGAQDIGLNADGNLILHTPGGDVVEDAPVLYQGSGVGRQLVAGHYVLEGNGRIGFSVGAYDSSRSLVIDPALSYATYLGGAGIDYASGIALDSDGNAYVVGRTQSSDFPTTPGAYQTSGGGPYTSNAFVAKLNADGTALIYSTYLGIGDCGASAIAVDGAGDAYVVGYTYGNFPTTPGAFQTSFGGGQDAFITELNGTGTALIYSTYLGGSGYDSASAIAVDGAGDAYVAGQTLSSSDFPTTPGAFQTSGIQGESSAFVTELNTTGAALVYSTYLGAGTQGLVGSSGIAVDSAGDAYVAGRTSANYFPITPGAYQTQFQGGGVPFTTDGFVVKFNATGTGLLYATYWSGAYGGNANAIAVDSAGNAYVAGGVYPNSGGFAGGVDGLVTELNATGTGALFSTTVDSADSTNLTGIVITGTGNAYVAGYQRFAGVGGGYYDGLVAELNDTGTLTYQQSLVGPTQAYAIAVDSGGDAYVVGYTSSTDFATPGAYQASYAGNGDAFVAKVPALQTITVVECSNTSAVYGEPITFTATVTDALTGLPVTSGSVSFTDSNSNVFGTAPVDSSGHATLTTSTLNAGGELVRADFGGSALYRISSSQYLQLSIAQAQVSTQVTTSPDPSAPGQAVTITATVTVNPPGGWVPGGTVTFIFKTTVTRNLDSNGQAIFTTPWPYGTGTITAVFNLGNNYLWSNASTVHQVARVATITSLASSRNPSMSGQPVTFSATVTAGSGTPTGTVNFTEGGTVLASVTLDSSGTATFTTSTFSSGNHKISAVYLGDQNFSGGTSPLVTQEVTGILTSVSLTSSLNPSMFGEPVTFTAAVSAGSGGTPTGTMNFMEGRTVLASVTLDSSGTATFTTLSLPSGIDKIIAAYLGSPVYGASTSAMIQTVNDGSTTSLDAAILDRLFSSL